MGQDTNTDKSNRPPLGLALVACVATVVAWGVIRLVIFHDSVMPLTYALPLLICVWTRDKRLLWGMAGVFALMASVKVWRIMPPEALPTFLDWAVYLAQLVNITVAGVAVHAIISLRDRLERKNAALAESNAQLVQANEEIARQNEALQRTNAELETANEELAAREEEISQQNEELHQQAEELAQQNEELRSQGEELEQQTEELTSQAEELQTANDELGRRGEVLEALLSAARSLAGEADVLSDVCRQGLRLLGGDVVGAAMLEAGTDALHVRSQVGLKMDGPTSRRWPLNQSLARLVMEEQRIAALEDLSLRPDLVFPQSNDGRSFRSALAAPLSVDGQQIGAVEFYSSAARPWTEGQFRLVEWVAAQCSAVLKMIRLRQEVQSGEERFRATFEQAAVGIAHVGLDGRWLRVNHRYCEILGYERDELLKLTFQDITHPDDLEADLAQTRRLVDEEIDVYAMEKRYVRKDGSSVWVNLTGSLVRDASGAAAYCIAVAEDISKRKKAEAALRESRARLSLALEAIGASHSYWDMRTGALEWNARAYELMGYEPNSFTPNYEAWRSRIHPDDVEWVEASVHECMEQHKDFLGEYRVVWPGGTVHWVRAARRFEYDRHGQPATCTSILHDITDIKQAEERANAANRAKDHFLAVLSHELRTPLNPALMAATILENSPQLPPELREDVGIIRRNVELEARLIDDMLDLTRIARGKLTLNRRMVDGREVLRYAVETCQAEAAEKGLSVQVKMPSEPILTYADPARLQQVFWNLIKNAVKFTSDPGRIVIMASMTAQGGLHVEVSDTGRGIEKSALEQIFDAFEQGGPSVTNRYGGLGLGLAICKGLVTMHEGTIHASSDGPNKGASFVVELPPPSPRQTKQADQPESPTATVDSLPGTGCRILLVEDHESTAVMTAKLLQSFGHQVVTANCIDCALKAFDQQAFDLVVSDLGLPDGSGQDLLRRLAAGGPVRAIALSGYGMDSDFQRSAEAGFLEHLVKPINARQLQDAITRALGRDHCPPALPEDGHER